MRRTSTGSRASPLEAASRAGRRVVRRRADHRGGADRATERGVRIGAVECSAAAAATGAIGRTRGRVFAGLARAVAAHRRVATAAAVRRTRGRALALRRLALTVATHGLVAAAAAVAAVLRARPRLARRADVVAAHDRRRVGRRARAAIARATRSRGKGRQNANDPRVDPHHRPRWLRNDDGRSTTKCEPRSDQPLSAPYTDCASRLANAARNAACSGRTRSGSSTRTRSA